MTSIQQATTILTINATLTSVNNNPATEMVGGETTNIADQFPNTVTRTIKNQVIVTAGTVATQGRMFVTETNAQIPIGSIEVVGYYHLVNCSDQSINICDSSGNVLCVIPPGWPQLIPANAPLYAQATPVLSYSPIVLQYLVTEYLGMLAIPSGDEAY